MPFTVNLEDPEALKALVEQLRQAGISIESDFVNRIQNAGQSVGAVLIDRAIVEAGNTIRGPISEVLAAIAPFATELKRFNDSLELLIKSGIDVGGLPVKLLK